MRYLIDLINITNHPWPSGGRGQGFESLRARQTNQRVTARFGHPWISGQARDSTFSGNRSSRVCAPRPLPHSLAVFASEKAPGSCRRSPDLGALRAPLQQPARRGSGCAFWRQGECDRGNFEKLKAVNSGLEERAG